MAKVSGQLSGHLNMLIWLGVFEVSGKVSEVPAY